MKLVSLTYVSTLKKDTDATELFDLNQISVKNNAQLEVSGILLFSNDYFLQHLEGGREVVNALFHKIANDSRHEHVLLLNYSEIFERDFEKWGMKLALLTKEKAQTILKYSIHAEFNPYLMSGPSALAFLKTFRD